MENIGDLQGSGPKISHLSKYFVVLYSALPFQSLGLRSDEEEAQRHAGELAPFHPWEGINNPEICTAPRKALMRTKLTKLGSFIMLFAQANLSPEAVLFDLSRSFHVKIASKYFQNTLVTPHLVKNRKPKKGNHRSWSCHELSGNCCSRAS